MSDVISSRLFPLNSLRVARDDVAKTMTVRRRLHTSCMQMARRCMHIVITILHGQVAVMCDRASPLANGGSQAGPTHCRNLVRIAGHRTSHQHLLTFTGSRPRSLAASYTTNSPLAITTTRSTGVPRSQVSVMRVYPATWCHPRASRQPIVVGRRVCVRIVRESSV